MSVSRRAIVCLVLLLAAGAAAAWLVPRVRDRARHAATTGTVTETKDPAPGAPASETLIAAALLAGEITYEESLLARAYALYDDPRLQAAFRSPIVNWDAGLELWLEIDANEAKLSKPLLDQLTPFRLRPNHPDSIYNRPRADVVRTQAAAAPAWSDLPVPNSNLRLWIEGSQLDLEPFQDAAELIWKAFPAFFTYPLPDTPGGSSWFNSEKINTDSRIDIYFVDGARADPRLGLCEKCELGGNPAETKPADPRRGRTSSGYVLINKSLPPDQLFSTMAHELAHVSQLAHDVDERARMWLLESTAAWVAYKVTKANGKTPAWEYSLLDPARAADHDFPPLYAVLDEQLIDFTRRYPAWLFFHSASLDAGNGIVKAIWQRAAEEEGAQGHRAVDDVIPFKDHFPRFAMRNWNHDLMADTYRYQAKDTSFPADLRPRLRVNPAIFGGPGIEELTEPVPRLAAQYYRFQFLEPVRRITIRNPYVKLENAHVWGLRKIGDVWKEPEDWTGEWERVFCRDTMDENITELVIVVSNSDLDDEIPTGHPKPRVIAEAEGCKLLEGFGKSTLRLKDDTQDVTYVSSQVPLKFKPRSVQGPDGNVEYDLLPTSVTWRVSGRRHDCRIEGEAIVNIPMRVDQPLDPTLPAYGYMNVVVQRNGDYHSVEVSAIDARAIQTVTCPGNPPVVTKEPFRVQYLLHVLHQANTHETGGAIVYKGKQTFDPARIQNNLPMSPGSALSNLLTSPGGAFITPEIQRQLKEAQGALDRIAAEGGGKVVYTFEWELKP